MAGHGHAPKASSNHGGGGGGLNLGAGPWLLALCLVVASSVVAILWG